MRERLHFRGAVIALASAMVLVIVAAVLLVRGQDDGCPGRAVYHLAAGTCMDPSSLDVDGERAAVEAAVSRYDGSILFTTSGSHHVRFPVQDAAALDRIKDELTAAGFEVRYSLVIEVP
jgi:hypothetical protein